MALAIFSLEMLPTEELRVIFTTPRSMDLPLRKDVTHSLPTLSYFVSVSAQRQSLYGVNGGTSVIIITYIFKFHFEMIVFGN